MMENVGNYFVFHRGTVRKTVNKNVSLINNTKYFEFNNNQPFTQERKSPHLHLVLHISTSEDITL